MDIFSRTYKVVLNIGERIHQSGLLRKILVLPLMFCYLITFCQSSDREVDSLIEVLRTAANDSSKVEMLNNISIKLRRTSDYTEAMKYGTQALQLAQKIKFDRGLADAYNNISAIHNAWGNYGEVLEYSVKALKIAERIVDKSEMAESNNMIGAAYSRMGNQSEALKYFLNALETAEEINDKATLADIYNNLGILYRNQEKHDEAMKSYLTAKKLAEEVGNKNSIVNIYNNIGSLYLDKHEFNEALKTLFEALKIEKQINYKLGIANTYNNIGVAYRELGNYNEALKNHFLALETAVEIKDKLITAYSYMNIGHAYIKQKRYAEAREYINNGLQIAKETKNKRMSMECYNTLSTLNSDMGNFKEAYFYQQLSAAVKDSLFNEESERQNAWLKIQYETDKKDNQIKTQSLQLQNQALRNNILQSRIYYAIVVSLLVIGIIVLLFYMRSRRNKKEYENKVVTLELTALKSQLNPHFIFNALNSIKEYIESNPQTGADYLTRFSLLMRGVLDGSEEKEISLGEEMQLMKHYIELEGLRLPHGLNYSITYDESTDKETIMIPSLITQPMIENAIRHGLSSLDTKGELTIHNSMLQDKLFITISNSRASSDNEEWVNSTRRKSFGVKITKERLMLLKQTTGTEGKLNFQKLPDKTIVTLTIPLAQV